ncbi:MAG: purine-binding chemotaxis protein CheW [Ahniella sp.]|nr:purine-binding chemotaxis protein CheW [Ahniella sp.]
MNESEAMLSPFETLLDYENRSLSHVAGLPEQIDAPGLWRGIAFRLGRRLLASSITEVTEILSFPVLTGVPGAKPWLMGVANVRGNLVSVIDIKCFVEGERSTHNEKSRVLVIRQQGSLVGLLVDEILGSAHSSMRTCAKAKSKKTSVTGATSIVSTRRTMWSPAFSAWRR